MKLADFFRSGDGTGPYFEGWYWKHQNPQGQALALIPAFHIDGEGRRSASLQVISKDRSWRLECPEERFQVSRRPFHIQAGQSSFDSRGILLRVEEQGLSLRGALGYGPLTPLRSPIMGPFRLFAGMQCSHGVVSMGHSLKGKLELNGETLDFTDGIGYIETDRGRSFPDSYLWTQCAWGRPKENGLMLAAATIPLPVGGFTGCLCSILRQGREYRLATYLGAKIEAWSSSGAVVRQGKYRLEARLLGGRGQALRAPKEGRMERTVCESLSAKMRYRFWRGKDLLFQHTDANASFEYAPGPSDGRPSKAD